MTLSASDARIEYAFELDQNKKNMKANQILLNDLQYCEQCASWYDYTITTCCPCCGN